MELRLPKGCTILTYDHDLVITGPHMTTEEYEELKAQLPKVIADRVIGFRSVAGRS